MSCLPSSTVDTPDAVGFGYRSFFSLTLPWNDSTETEASPEPREKLRLLLGSNSLVVGPGPKSLSMVPENVLMSNSAEVLEGNNNVTSPLKISKSKSPFRSSSPSMKHYALIFLLLILKLTLKH